MKEKSFGYLILAAFLILPISAQTAGSEKEDVQSKRDRQIQNLRSPNQKGINQFESIKDKAGQFRELEVQLGGAFSLQYQGLKHKNEATFVDDGSGNNTNELIGLGDNFNLATANLDLRIQLADGLMAHSRTYLSSRHHTEAYVKDGYLQIDRLGFISKGFLDNVMDMVTIKVGHMEVNYGDAHFRRSDNGLTIYNPFVGNLILDSFTTEVAGEIYLRNNGFMAMVGASNGKLNQDVRNPDKTDPAALAKLGYDRQLTSDLRVRLTGSLYHTRKAKSLYLYSGDRAGARYYSVMRGVTATSDDFRSGRWNPAFSQRLTSVMINPFVKWKGLEFFGTYELAKGGDSAGSPDDRTWHQIAAELIYRFGWDENLYVGARYNTAYGKESSTDSANVEIKRVQGAFGWFLTPNVLAKLEYVRQDYKGFNSTSIYKNGKFDGIMVESAISF